MLVLAYKDFHLGFGNAFVQTICGTTDDGNTCHGSTHCNNSAQHITYLGTPVYAKVLHLANVTHWRFCCTLTDCLVTCKCRCTLGNVFYHTRFCHLSVRFDKVIILSHRQLTCALVAFYLQQLVHHHDGRALWYKFFNLTDGSRCSHTSR